MRNALLALTLLAACIPERTTHRLMTGISMGGIGASMIALRHPLDFDGMGALGGPLDAAFLAHTIDHVYLGGFCSRAELEALMQQFPDDPTVLNDPARLAACMPLIEGRLLDEHTQNFSHWYFTTSGGTFDRSSYLNLFLDVSLAFGNPLYWNPESKVAPPGVDPELLRHPPADICTNPIVVPGFLNAEYNPDGRYDAITFCDGEEDPIYVCRASGRAVSFCAEGAAVIARSDEAAFAARFCGEEGVDTATSSRFREVYFQEKGRYDACREHSRLFAMALALDLNGNRRRDYGEPVLNNGAERFSDTGRDGCFDADEDGAGGCRGGGAGADPNGDDYDLETNPTGTERNWRRDDAEPFLDHGLDGVPNSGDFGEGNGKFTLSPNRVRMAEHDPRTRFERFPDPIKRRLDYYGDGGMRDVFNFGVQGRVLFGAIGHAMPQDTLRAPAMTTLASTPQSATFDGAAVSWGALPRNVFVRYGNPNADFSAIADGDGGHMGTVFEAVQRLLLLMGWASERWSYLPERSIPEGGSPLSARLREETFYSEKLGSLRNYGLFLPPGYDAPGNDERYPVLYFLHGYGMQVVGGSGVLPLGVAFDAYMAARDLPFREYIVVFPSGQCCFRDPAGQRVCNERDAEGTYYGAIAGYERECHSGSFYVDRVGYTPGDETLYEAALMELVEHIDRTYRTRVPVKAETRPNR